MLIKHDIDLSEGISYMDLLPSVCRDVGSLDSYNTCRDIVIIQSEEYV